MSVNVLEIKVDEVLVLKWLNDGVKLIDIVYNILLKEGIMKKFDE